MISNITFSTKEVEYTIRLLQLVVIEAKQNGVVKPIFDELQSYIRLVTIGAKFELICTFVHSNFEIHSSVFLWVDGTYHLPPF
jgi:hypothetical protein